MDKNGRLESLDALRGFDMLMIMGFGAVVTKFCVLCGWGADCWLAEQFQHVEWHGLRFEDTIFPLFLFLAGVSWPFSFAKQSERGDSTRRIVLRCLKRAALLSLFGFLHQGVLGGYFRVGNVLTRIDLAWMIGALLFMGCRTRTRVALALLLPIAHWLLLWFVPAPDALTVVPPAKMADTIMSFGTGPYSIVGNLSGWVDRHVIPGPLSPYIGVADNQSALGLIPAVGTALLGMLTGEFVQKTRASMADYRRIGFMLLSAIGLIGLGLFIANGFGEMSMPINKKLWDAPFVFVVGGYSVMMFALFHGIVDVLGCRKWAFFFRVIGMNSITIYLAQRFIPFRQIAKNLVGDLTKLCPPAVDDFLMSVAYVAVCWLFLFFLYRKNVFLRV